jgi:hypothetical protein
MDGTERRQQTLSTLRTHSAVLRRPQTTVWVPCISIAAMLLLAAPLSAAERADGGYSILAQKDGFRLQAGSLRRTVVVGDQGLSTTHLSVAGDEVLTGASSEFSVRVSTASPNRKPRGLATGEGGSLDWTPLATTATDTSRVKNNTTGVRDDLQWVDAVHIDGSHWSDAFTRKHTSIKHDGDTDQLTITGLKDGLECSLHYVVYRGDPAIRKWVSFTNTSSKWIKLDQLKIEDWGLAPAYRKFTALTPSERGARSSLQAAGSADATKGLILGSEIPSALRDMQPDGSMGYTDEFFEWVLGPGESFTTEPVFTYAYAGPVASTPSSTSTPLDRAIEGPFQAFLRQRIKLLVDTKNQPAPYYSTWTHFGSRIDSANVLEMTAKAAAAGFRMVQLDDGWQKDRLGAEPETATFPDFAATTASIRAQGLRLGLWISSFRTPGLRALTDVPDAPSRPIIKRSGGEGVSFSDPRWREYYSDELANLAKTYGATYFKQDFSNIRYGDLAEGHESRTLKESLLRGLRGLLTTEDLIRQKAPGVTLELTHEIYWGTPGVPCDLAVLQHVNQYHVPPNDYSGAGDRMKRAANQKTPPLAPLQQQLRDGSMHARERFYAHRGLPLGAIEYYGATTASFGGSLTPDLQDRQVASWLMGAPMVFSGDLASLSAENIARYHDRFALLKHLQDTYAIYEHFQFSGVPSAPTDTDWEWWGKLTPQGYGAVVVLRGSQGSDTRAINVPWVQPKRRYKAKALFTGHDLGTFTGAELQAGSIHLSLPMYGQEIVELSPE